MAVGARRGAVVLAHERVDDAARAASAEGARQRVGRSSAARCAAARSAGLGGAHERAADLRRTRIRRQHGGNAGAVGDPTRGDHRQVGVRGRRLSTPGRPTSPRPSTSMIARIRPPRPLEDQLVDSGRDCGARRAPPVAEHECAVAARRATAWACRRDAAAGRTQRLEARRSRRARSPSASRGAASAARSPRRRGGEKVERAPVSARMRRPRQPVRGGIRPRRPRARRPRRRQR